jgi:outer membrane receptor for ferrienterochelin and colicins
MKNIFSALFLMICFMADAQNSFRAVVKDAETREPLTGASAVVMGTESGSSSDAAGLLEITNIPAGRQVIIVSFIGYARKEISVHFPMSSDKPLQIYLEPEESDLEEVIVSATRSSRSIYEIPTRVEVVSSEELDEKITMQPSNVRMILTESTGIQTQQTSATSANAGIRIQGLEGKYTMLLRDGFPVYSGYSSGLSIMQVPPLDLQRVELIKGSSSTLYGGGAIAGLINFITKTPGENKELSFLTNVNHTGALDLNGYYSEKFRKTGVTLFASHNLQKAYDPNKDTLSDIPEFSRFNFNPRIFFYPDNSTTISFGINSSFENRLGGDMLLIKNGPDPDHIYFEKNSSNRISSQFKIEKKYSGNRILTIKNSTGYFGRTIQSRNFYYPGKEVSGYSEVNYLISKVRSEWIIGSNLWFDHFKGNSTYQIIIPGVFVQNTLNAGSKLIVESGLRVDYANNELLVLPRLSLLYKLTRNFSGRISGGTGYKAPSPFSEEAEEKGYYGILTDNIGSLSHEKSIGGTADLNFKTFIDKLSISVNHMFFYNRLKDPIQLFMVDFDIYRFQNRSGYLQTRGMETNLKLEYHNISAYIGYTFTDTERHLQDLPAFNPLTAKHRIYSTLLYELENKLRFGYELFYTGKQTLSSGEIKKDYWVMGISGEYKFKKFSLFINAENFTDSRQTRYENINAGTLQNPEFKDIWAPTDGIIVNGGFKFSVFN